MDYVTWRDCFLANAEEFFEEIAERLSDDYDPYDYVFEENLGDKYEDHKNRLEEQAQKRR